MERIRWRRMVLGITDIGIIIRRSVLGCAVVLLMVSYDLPQVSTKYSPDPKKPSVYISYVGPAEFVESCTSQRRLTHKLRLHNNTTRPINVASGDYSSTAPTRPVVLMDGTTAAAFPEGASVQLCYELEREVISLGRSINGLGPDGGTPKNLPEIPKCTLCSTFQQQVRYDFAGLWISPGATVVFEVPRVYFERDMKISTFYSYEWEFDTRGHKKPDEPQHRVYFYGSEL